MNLHPCSQSGNALWFILLAVALLGFLTAIVSRTSSSVEQSGSVEQARIKAAALIRYTTSIQAAVQQMTINGGVSENDLDFKALGGPYDNPACTEDRCDVFSMEGGGISYRPAAEVLVAPGFTGAWVVSGSNRIGEQGCDTADVRCNELLLLLPGVPEQTCLQVNALQDVDNPSEAPPRQNGVLLTPAFSGTFSAVNPNIIGGSNATNESSQLKGKSTGCLYDFGAGNHTVFYQVLIAR